MSVMPFIRGLALRHLRLGVLIAFLGVGVAECALTIGSPLEVVTPVGSSTMLSVAFSGVKNPIIAWSMGNVTVVTWIFNISAPQIISVGQDVLGIANNGSLTFQNVQSNYTNTYTVTMTETGLPSVSATFQLRVFGAPVCSVTSANGGGYLQYLCKVPNDHLSQLSFPALNDSASGNSTFSLVVPATSNLNGQQITCVADQLSLRQSCSVAAGAPQGLLPVASTKVDANGWLVVTITCQSGATPPALVIWTKGGQVLTNGGPYQISSDTTQLTLSKFNLNSSLDLRSYTCNSGNPLGNVTKNIQLTGPSISDSSIIINSKGTVVTLTWQVPPTSVITGFNIQMLGPNLQSSKRRRKRASDGYRTVAVQSSSGRSQDLSVLDPQSTYWFRVVPFAGIVTGPPSVAYQVGPGNQGLSTQTILGLAIGIPCAFVFLLLLIVLIVFCVYCRRRRREPRYPVARAVEKVVAVQPNTNTPNALMTGGLKNTSPQISSEQSPPSINTSQPMRIATMV